MTHLVLGLAFLLAAAPASGSRTTPIAVGEAAPDFTLESSTGGRVSLSQSLANGPTVLVFYRGHWCPFCARQLKELASLVRPGEKVNLFAVSVEDTATNKQFASKLGVAFPLLSDPNHETIDAYGLHDPAYDGDEFDGIPRAAVYVIGRDGKVKWAKVSDDYKVRPSNADVRAALSGL
jgi:peroxiredoxin